MPLKNPPQEGASILYVGFNQDYTCLSIADFTGIKIYSLDTHKICYQADLGAVRCLSVPVPRQSTHAGLRSLSSLA